MTGPAPWLEIEQIIGRLRHAVDLVMGEAGLWDERTAARAFRHAEGDAVAAAGLVQALRASLPRFGTAALVERPGLSDDGERPGPPAGDARHEQLPVVVTHPATGEAVTIGHIRVTEVEVLRLVDGPGGASSPVAAGYGVCLGHNERKAIAMAQLDRTDRGLSPQALLEQLRRPGGCGVGAASGLDG